MTTYIRITADELPAQISDPVSSEVLPMLEAIDSTKNMVAICVQIDEMCIQIDGFVLKNDDLNPNGQEDWMDKETRANPGFYIDLCRSLLILY